MSTVNQNTNTPAADSKLRGAHDRDLFPSIPAKPPWREKLEDAGMKAAARLGVVLHRAVGSRAGDALGILTYHRIAPHVPGLPAPLHNVTPHRFRRQLQGLQQRGFSFWRLSQVLAYHRRGRPLPRRTLVVTFDDGFESVYREAWPVLCELQIPATIFLNTAYLNAAEPFPFDAWGMRFALQTPPMTWRPLRIKQCREMAQSGWIELGAHTHTHQDFRGRPEEFRADLQRSVDRVRELFGVEEMTFAFPFGGPHLGFAGGSLEKAARRTDVACALSTESVLVDVASDPFTWGRMNAFPWDTPATLAAKFAGWYSWAPKLRQRLASAIRQARRRRQPQVRRATTSAGNAAARATE